jgi:hypothetical protein
MKRGRPVFLCLQLLALLFLLSACVIYSENPLSDPATAVVDESLIGTWYWNGDEDMGYIHIGKAGSGREIIISMIKFRKDGSIVPTIYRGHSCQTGKRRYLSLKHLMFEQLDKRYFFVEYEVKGDSIEVALLNNKLIESAIKGGSLKGEIIRNPKDLQYGVVIQAGQGDLQKFIIGNEDKIAVRLFRYAKLERAALRVEKGFIKDFANSGTSGK